MDKRKLYEIQRERDLNLLVYLKTKKGLIVLLLSGVFALFFSSYGGLVSLAVGGVVFFVAYKLSPPTVRDLRNSIFNEFWKRKWEKEEQLSSR